MNDHGVGSGGDGACLRSFLVQLGLGVRGRGATLCGGLCGFNYVRYASYDYILRYNPALSRGHHHGMRLPRLRDRTALERRGVHATLWPWTKIGRDHAQTRGARSGRHRPSGRRRRRRSRSSTGHDHQDRSAAADLGTGLLFRRAGQARCRARARRAQQVGPGLQVHGPVRGLRLRAPARHPGGQASDRAVQTRRGDRRGMLGRDARGDADHGAGQDPAAQCRLVRDQDHRSRQSLDVPHHAERGDAGRGYRHQRL